MANLTGTPAYQNFVRRLETTDPRHPDTWNPNYQNLINNDAYLKERADQVDEAKGDYDNLAARLESIDAATEALGPDTQDSVLAAIKFAIDQAHLANQGVRALHQFVQQEGVLEIINRGVVSGCTVTKSTTAARNLHLSIGTCFALGRKYSVLSGSNVASVPSNTSSGAVTVFAYLVIDVNGLWRLAVTSIGQEVPANGIRLYNLTVPAGSTDATDPNLAAVTLTDVRRVEAGFPILLDNPASASPQLATLPDAGYHVAFDVLSAIGAPAEAKSLVVASRANNGFTVQLAAAADNVLARWRISRLNA